jgi:predicted chitinase
MWQGLAGMAKRFSGAALLFSSLSMLLAAQDAEAACRGAWTEGSAYNAGDGVTYNGNSYSVTQSHTACKGCDVAPSTSPLWKTGGDCGSDTLELLAEPPSTSATGIAAILSQATYNKMFPNHNGFYTYAALVAAANTFPAFATTGTLEQRKREVAAFLANVGHETGNLVHIEEGVKNVMCDTSWGPPGCGCAAGKKYFGRGPIQLSWNGNYCAAGNALGADLKNNPNLVAENPTLSWRTGFWFWMTQTGAGSMTSHSAIINNRGFGETIRTINGALECNGKSPAQVQSRVDNYKRLCNMLGVAPGTNLQC